MAAIRLVALAHDCATMMGWCGKCSSKVDVSGPGYANAYGKHTYGKYWDLTLRLTARLGFLLDRMLTMDVVAVERFCHDAPNETNAARHAQIMYTTSKLPVRVDSFALSGKLRIN